ncbi:hypothetical protein [Streptomyces sp. NPDC047718]|uniref:hypothetical protein n=1 Tax=Streptomyces sp. NPDC047718 TaxID=3155479 RepID=UPI00340CCFEC
MHTTHHMPRTPPALQAFIDLQHRHYLAYARTLLPADQALTAVITVLTRLAAAWNSLVTEANPTAHAWDELTRTVHSHTSQPPDLRDDLATLASLGYGPHACARITGRDLGKIHYLTRTP